MLNPMIANVECLNYGCQLQKALAILRQASEMQARAQAMLESAERDNMSRALWCDSGGHAFSERDPGRQRITVEVLDEDENVKEDFRQFCGECAEKAGLLKRRVSE